MPRFKIGFTGTQQGMTERQKTAFQNVFGWFYKTYADRGVEFHQGQCIGADHEALLIARSFSGVWTVSHPPANRSRIHTVPCDESRSEGEYLERNHWMVDEVDVLLAAPRTRNEELRSGTWATIRYARKREKPIEMLYPSA